MSEETSLIKLDGLEPMEILLRNLPDEWREKLTLDKKKYALIEAHLSGNATLSLKNRLPMVCEGEDCPYQKVCVYYKAGLAPRGHGCPEEKIIIEQIVPQLIKDLDVDLEKIIELDMISEYTDAVLQEVRAQRQIAVEGQVLESVTTVDPRTGIAYYEKKEAPSLLVKERAQRRKAQLRKDFLATREQRAKFHLDVTEDESTAQAKKRKAYERVMERNPEAFTDASFEDVPEGSDKE